LLGALLIMDSLFNLLDFLGNWLIIESSLTESRLLQTFVWASGVALIWLSAKAFFPRTLIDSMAFMTTMLILLLALSLIYRVYKVVHEDASSAE